MCKKNAFPSHRLAVMVLLAFLCSLLPNKTRAQDESLYTKHINMARMLQSSGNMMMAEKHYKDAYDNTSDEHQRLLAQLGQVDVLKFLRPVEAQRLNDELEETSRNYPECRQMYLALNGFIAFRLNNMQAFEQANKEYLLLCQQNESLPTTYDLALQAMHEAMNGYPDEALKTLSDNNIDVLTRHELRTIIFELSGDKQKVIDELRLRAATIDSLSTVLYEKNQTEEDIITGMTKASEAAAKNRTSLQKIILALVVVVLLILLAWLYYFMLNKKRLQNKNEQLATALKMAGESDQMKSEFVRRISHEIRTPLNAISGFNEILNNPDIQLAQEERNELTTRIKENVKAITAIVDELLQVADDKSVMEYAKNDEILCNQFFSELIYKYRGKVNTNIELKYTTQVINRFSITTNAEAVEKIVEHLIQNALKCTQHGYIELNCKEENKKLFVTVSDTGCGIPAENQDKIFDQFTKVDAFKQGIGLGLTVSRKIAQRLGGNLELDKTYTTGARFILTLPEK